jgi:hypothetical protein
MLAFTGLASTRSPTRPSRATRPPPPHAARPQPARAAGLVSAALLAAKEGREQKTYLESWALVLPKGHRVRRGVRP